MSVVDNTAFPCTTGSFPFGPYYGERDPFNPMCPNPLREHIRKQERDWKKWEELWGKPDGTYTTNTSFKLGKSKWEDPQKEELRKTINILKEKNDESLTPAILVLYAKLAELGEAGAMHTLGYQYSRMGEKDEAIYWYRLASEKNQIASHNHLAWLLWEKAEKTDNVEEAVELKMEALASFVKGMTSNKVDKEHDEEALRNILRHGSPRKAEAKKCPPKRKGGGRKK